MHSHHLDALILASLLATGGCTDRADDLEPQADMGSTGSTTSAQSKTTAEAQGDSTGAETTGSDSAEDTTTGADSGSTTSAGESSSTGEGTESTGMATGPFSVSGQVTRSVEPAEGNDGVGTLYFAVVDSCGFSFELIATGMLSNADTSEPVPYTVTDVPDGDWYMIVYLDDDDDAMLPEPAPDSGDLVVSKGAGVGCAELTVDGDDVDGIDLDLNFVLP